MILLTSCYIKSLVDLQSTYIVAWLRRMISNNFELHVECFVNQ